MNILFLTMSSSVKNIQSSGIYNDLIRMFRDEGHNVYIIYPNERRSGLPTALTINDGINCLAVRTLNLQKTTIFEKGIGQLLLESQFKFALKRYFYNVKFDLILYSTPPITFNNVIKYAKKKSYNNVLTYLLLKDIFPQNAVDLGMMSKTGVKSILYKMFRKKEEELYCISDYIGCMSPANVEYLLKHNPSICKEKVEVAPNSCDIPNKRTTIDKVSIRKKYNLPIDKPILIYGGNMGKPQGISFLIKCMQTVKERNDCHFLIIGDGTEYHKLETFMKENMPKSISLFRILPKDDYDVLVEACDVGLIFLDYRFTIPNYPSRLLSFLIGKKPIIAITDSNCDVGTIAEKNGYGFYCPSNSVEAFTKTIDKILASDIKTMGEKGYQFFLDNYTTEHTYNTIIKHLK